MRHFKPYPHTALLYFLAIFLAFGIPSFTTAKSDSPPLLLAKQRNQKSLSIVKKIRHSVNPDRTRIVVDLSQSVSYKVTRHPSSRTVRIKLEKARLAKSLKQHPVLDLSGPLVKRIGVKQKGKGRVDITLSYKGAAVHKYHALDRPDRLVIDLYPVAAAPPPRTRPRTRPSFEVKTIVIDPGHGGKDPGARSRGGLKEKDVVLDISLRLKKLIKNRLKKKVIMTRNRDVFISLKKRTRIANDKHADLFISVHVNASESRRLKGIEVYLLGRASSKRAMRVAARENAAAHGAAIDLQKMILNDLEREFTKNASLELAHFTNNAIKKNLISKYPTAALGVKHAPFFVLAHTDMPAILAEISFLSNQTEEKRLRSKRYRQRAAEALLKGIEAYIHSLEVGS